MIKKIIRKILGPKQRAFVDRLMHLKDQGNLKIGSDNNIGALSIHHDELTKGFCNVDIGNSNFLENSITIYSSKSKIIIGDRTYIGHNTSLNCRESIDIGDDVMISWSCTLMDTNAHSLKSIERKDDVLNWKKGPGFKNWADVDTAKIIIGKKCWIGFNSIILKGVTLGEGCIVASGSVVTKSFEAFSVVGGNPAKFIKKTI